MDMWGRGVAAERLTQAVGPCLAEDEPVSYVELRKQTVLHHLVHVVTRGTPQAAAEHGGIQTGALQTRKEKTQSL